MTVAVLQSLARERRAPRGRAEQETAPTLVAERPDEVADALEAEHRIEDEERDHRLAPRRVRGAGGGERRHRAGLGDALLEDAPVARLLVREQQLGVDRLVRLAERRVDLVVAEQRVEPERARLVGDDRHDARADTGIAQQVAQQPRERGGRARLHLLAGPGEDVGERSVRRERQRLGPHDALGHRAIERADGAPSCTRTQASRCPGASTAGRRRRAPRRGSGSAAGRGTPSARRR